MLLCYINSFNSLPEITSTWSDITGSQTVEAQTPTITKYVQPQLPVRLYSLVVSVTPDNENPQIACS
jgi:hypothetical protein